MTIIIITTTTTEQNKDRDLSVSLQLFRYFSEVKKHAGLAELYMNRMVRLLQHKPSTLGTTTITTIIIIMIIIFLFLLLLLFLGLISYMDLLCSLQPIDAGKFTR